MAALQNTLHVSEFSPDGKFYAFLSQDGKLKIWDTETGELKQEFVPQLHLTVPFTCFTWINIAPQSDTQFKSPKKQRDAAATTPYIAIGTKRGTVTLYSFARGDIDRDLKGSHESEITAICQGPQNTLFTSGTDKRVMKWDLRSGESTSNLSICQEIITSLIYLNKSKSLLVAGRKLYLWSIDKNQVLETFTGHQSTVTALLYFPIKSEEYVLSTAKQERVLNVWRMTNNKNAPISFIMEDIAYAVTHRVDSKGVLKIAAVTRSGVLHLYSEEIALERNSSKSIRPKSTIEIVNDKSQLVEPIPVIAAMLLSHAQKQLIKIGYGERQRLRFEVVEFNLNEKRSVLIRGDAKKTSKTESEFLKKKSIAALKTLAPYIDVSKVDYQTPVSSVPRKGKKTSEIPMETRLENLSFGIGAKQARNIAQLLIQALHSHDVNLMRIVFLNQEEQVIRSTLQRLPPQYLRPLVKELTLLAQKKSINAHAALLWLKHLIQTQTSQLMAVGNIEIYSQFGPLLGIIEHRTNSLPQLSKLCGRLDLLVNQLKQNVERDDVFEDGNLLVYEDQDSSESDEIPHEGGSSDEQWNEEDDVDDDEEEDSPKEKVLPELMDIDEESEDDSDDE